MKPGERLHVETRGDLSHRAVVFLHGFLGDRRDWHAVVRALPVDLGCVMVDLPGHGQSPAPGKDGELVDVAERVADAVRHHIAAPCVLAGYSLGGRVAMEIARQGMLSLCGMVLESCAPGIRDEHERRARRVSDEAWAQLMEREPLDTFLDAWYAQEVFAGVSVRAENWDAMLARRRELDPHAAAAALRVMSVGRQAPCWEALAELDIPVLLIAGACDGKYVDITAQMRDLCRQGRRVIVPRAGHNVHVDAPAAFMVALQDWLAALSA